MQANSRRHNYTVPSGLLTLDTVKKGKNCNKVNISSTKIAFDEIKSVFKISEMFSFGKHTSYNKTIDFVAILKGPI